MEHFALDILLKKEGENYVPSQAARELSEKYDEVLLDEYQDSNLVQEILMQTVSGWVNERKNIFMVGDVKQSIYVSARRCRKSFCTGGIGFRPMCAEIIPPASRSGAIFAPAKA